MTSRDYTKEIGVNAGNAKIPLPYALALLATVAAASFYGFVAIHDGDAKEPEIKDVKAVVTAAHAQSGGR